MNARSPQVRIRFYEELNFFLSEDRRKQELTVAFQRGDTVKALIESLGIPHPEVDLILAEGKPVSFAYRLRDGDRISVYPVFESLDISPVNRLRAWPLRRTRFVLDVHLGRLATCLRLLGFDSLYANSYDDDALAAISTSQGRILLTRDRGLLKRRIVTHGYCLRSQILQEQALEVLKRFDLGGQIRPFSICLRCNLPLRRIAKERISGRLPPGVAARYDRFSICPSCRRIYWRGSHWEHLSRRVAELACRPTP